MGSSCQAVFSSYHLPNLKSRNQYLYPRSSQQKPLSQRNQLSRSIFNCLYPSLNQVHKPLLQHLVENVSTQFTDNNFLIKGERISKLYDLKRKLMLLLDKQDKIGNAVFQQMDVQMSYLAAVSYFLSANKHLLVRRILVTQQINNNHVYVFNFFCNGQNHHVIVDDFIPVFKDQRILYADIKAKQIWPLLLEKAWAKQIGSYEKAKGLSPQQCFQQITGIPTYSYLIDQSYLQPLKKLIPEFIATGYWCCVVARKQVGTFKNGQVFIVEACQQDSIVLLSAYTNFKSPTNQQPKKGMIKISFYDLMTHFQYLIIGFAKKNYIPVSYKFESKKREQKLFELDIKKSEQISLRFTQFYEGYLDDQQKSNYQYSSLITFQIYDKNYKLLNFCQGCDRISAGTHSSYFNSEILYLLQAGRYFLRIQVEWENTQIINFGNLVAYTSQNNIQIQQVASSVKSQLLKKMHINSLNLPNSVVTYDQKKTYQLRFLDKKNQILISIDNLSEQLVKLQLDFSKSLNFRVKNQTLLNGKKIFIILAPKQFKIIQILPQNLRQQFIIEPFDVKRLPNNAQ